MGQRWYERFPRGAHCHLPAGHVAHLAQRLGDRAGGGAASSGQARAAASVVAAALDRRAHSYISYMRAGSMLLGLKHEPTREDFLAVAGGMLEDAEYHGPRASAGCR
jgi:hypothetical protein